jgi:hypothetical protein
MAGKLKRKRKPSLPKWKAFRIARMKIGPSDMLVFRTEFILDRETVIALRDQLDRMLPAELKGRYILMTAGMQVAVLEKKLFTPAPGA